MVKPEMRMKGLIDSKVKSYLWKHFPGVQEREFTLSVAEFRRKHDRVTTYLETWMVTRRWPPDLQFWLDRWLNTRFNAYMMAIYRKWRVPRGEVKLPPSTFMRKPEGPPPRGWPWEIIGE